MSVLTAEWTCFLEAARTGSVTKAAESLKLPQPSVTKYLQRLERDLGIALLQRSNTGVRVTPAGKRLYQSMSGIYAQINGVLKSTTHEETQVSGHVSFGAHRALVRTYLIQPWLNLQRNHPHLEIHLDLRDSKEVARRVSEGKLDYGLVAEPRRLSGMVILPCAEEFAALFTAEGKSSEPTCVYYNPEMQQLPRIMKKFAHLRWIPISDYEILGDFARAGKKSAALLPSSVAARMNLRQQISPEFYRAKIALVFHRALPRSARHKAIVSAITGHLRMRA